MRAHAALSSLWLCMHQWLSGLGQAAKRHEKSSTKLFVIFVQKGKVRRRNQFNNIKFLPFFPLTYVFNNTHPNLTTIFKKTTARLSAYKMDFVFAYHVVALHISISVMLTQ